MSPFVARRSNKVTGVLSGFASRSASATCMVKVSAAGSSVTTGNLKTAT